jgi:hypothetical protein
VLVTVIVSAVVPRRRAGRTFSGGRGLRGGLAVRVRRDGRMSVANGLAGAEVDVLGALQTQAAEHDGGREREDRDSGSSAAGGHGPSLVPPRPRWFAPLPVAQVGSP